jgi:predicted secreted protein
MVAAAVLASVAHAGDYAERSIFGFSPSGAYFAFEEYGVQDGSGFPYANIYVINTLDDTWLPDTPIRVVIENDNSPTLEARARALSRASPILIENAIGTLGEMLVINPVTETSADPHFATFRRQPNVSLEDGDYGLALEEYELPAPDCPDMGQPYKGFRLTLTFPDGRVRVINEDEDIPASRRCPLSYGISDVMMYQASRSQRPVAVVLVNIFSLGFEGLDRRFMAIAAR